MDAQVKLGFKKVGKNKKITLHLERRMPPKEHVIKSGGQVVNGECIPGRVFLMVVFTLQNLSLHRARIVKPSPYIVNPVFAPFSHAEIVVEWQA